MHNLSKISRSGPTGVWAGYAPATTSCKNVEKLPRKNNLSCFKSLLATSLWDITLTSLLPRIQSCSSKFIWAWSCIASNFDKGWRGDHKHMIVDRPFMPKYGTVSKVLLQLVVKAGITCEVKHLNLSSVPSYWWYLERYFFVKVHLHSSWIFIKIMPFTPPKTKKKSFDFFTLKRSLPKLFQLFFSGLWFPFIKQLWIMFNFQIYILNRK